MKVPRSSGTWPIIVKRLEEGYLVSSGGHSVRVDGPEFRGSPGGGVSVTKGTAAGVPTVDVKFDGRVLGTETEELYRRAFEEADAECESQMTAEELWTEAQRFCNAHASGRPDLLLKQISKDVLYGEVPILEWALEMPVEDTQAVATSLRNDVVSFRSGADLERFKSLVFKASEAYRPKP